MRFLFWLLLLALWERWYTGGSFSLAAPMRRATLRRRARRALALNPAAFDARIDLAREAVERGRGAEALELLMPVMDRADGAAEIFRLHGRALLSVGRPAEAETSFRRALVADRRETDSRLGLAKALAAQGRFAEAATEVATYRVARPGDALGSWTESAILLHAGGPSAIENALAALRVLVSEQRLKPGYARRRDRITSIRARTALLFRRPPRRAW